MNLMSSYGHGGDGVSKPIRVYAAQSLPTGAAICFLPGTRIKDFVSARACDLEEPSNILYLIPSLIPTRMFNPLFEIFADPL